MVIDCFVKGDLKNIEMYIDDKLIKNFQVSYRRTSSRRRIFKNRYNKNDFY